MYIETRLGSFDDIVASQPQHREILLAVRTLVHAEMPDGQEHASARQGSIWWGTGPSKVKDSVAWCTVHKAHVNFGFSQATELDDPENLLEGTGASMRHVKLRSVEAVHAPALEKMLKSAVAFRSATKLRE